jgi:hypothetical protein
MADKLRCWGRLAHRHQKGQKGQKDQKDQKDQKVRRAILGRRDHKAC